MTDATGQSKMLKKTLMENWRREMHAASLYERSAQTERDEQRKTVLQQLADLEYRHAQMWADRLQHEGVSADEFKPPAVDEAEKPTSLKLLLQQIEEAEHGNMAWYQSLRNVVEDEGIIGIIDQIDNDEASHQDIDSMLFETKTAEKRLSKLWNNENHRQGTSDWVGDAIYGVNDGLGAIFGIISGVAGFTANTNTVLVSGMFGALASTLSMGAGAWLATKSENEVMQTTLAQERSEIEESPEHEIEELALLYQLKGFGIPESMRIAQQIAQDKDQFLKTMVQEEFGFQESGFGKPWRSAVFGGLSTLVGGIIPLIPFFFMSGIPALLAAAVISIVAHFAVGAAKSSITVRGWFSSGLEMTLVGVIVGLGSYLLGLLGAALFGAHLG